MTRLVALILVGLLISGCGDSRLTARGAVDEFVEAGLPAPNPQDVTGTACAQIGCSEAVQTDVVTVYRWADPAQAVAHAADLKQPAYSLNEFVIAFPVDTEADTSAYANTLQAVVTE